MNYIEAPQELYPTKEPSLFLGGGITDCPDWQALTLGMLKDHPITLINPRRAAFDLRDEDVSVNQIEWEHAALHSADAIMFWFPAETLCPITLYELGAWSKSDKKLFVGTHLNYQRRLDVVTQTRLARPGLKVVWNLEQVMDQIRDWLVFLSLGLEAQAPESDVYGIPATWTALNVRACGCGTYRREEGGLTGFYCSVEHSLD